MKIRQAPRILYLILILALMYVPIAVVIAYSFNESKSPTAWTGTTLMWYGQLFRDREMLKALGNSVLIGLLSGFAAAAIGTSAAYGVVFKKPILARQFSYISMLPILLPEITLGITFLAFFSLLRIPLGFWSLLLAHTAFCIPYIFLVVKARLAGMSRYYEEAARDLGATGMRAFFDVTFPLILPAIISGMLLAFAMSFDDVIISSLLTSSSFDLLPVKIYSQVKFGVTPKTNALCTILFAASAIFVALSAIFGSSERKKGA